MIIKEKERRVVIWLPECSTSAMDIVTSHFTCGPTEKRRGYISGIYSGFVALDFLIFSSLHACAQPLANEASEAGNGLGQRAT